LAELEEKLRARQPSFERVNAVSVSKLSQKLEGNHVISLTPPRNKCKPPLIQPRAVTPRHARLFSQLIPRLTNDQFCNRQKSLRNKSVQQLAYGISARQFARLSPDLKMLRALLATVYATAGDRVGAEGILSDLLTRASEEYVGPTMVSWIYANLDQPDRALEWLRKAGAEHDCTLAFGISWPIYDRISGDPRFLELVRHLHLA
jgi:hypothetical protein